MGLMDYSLSRNFLAPSRVKDPYGNTLAPKPFTGSVVEHNATPDDNLDFNQFDFPTPALDKYRDYLGTMPNEQDYKPSILRRILAGVAGASAGTFGSPEAGFETARGIVRAPYETALEKYKMGAGNMGELANIETTANASKIGNAFKLMQNQRDNAKLGIERFTALSNADLNDARVKDLANQALSRGQEIQKNDNDGFLYLIDKTGRNAPKNTGVKFGETPDEKTTRAESLFATNAKVTQNNDLAKIGAENRNRLGQIGAESGARINEFKVELPGREDEHRVNRQTDVANPIPQSVNENVQPSQSSIARRDAIQRAVSETPGWDKYVDKNTTTGQITGNMIDPSSLGRFSGADPADYQRFVKRVQELENTLVNRRRSGTPLVAAPAAPSPIMVNPPSNDNGQNQNFHYDTQGKLVPNKAPNK